MQETKKYWIDNLRAICTIAVVLLHVSAQMTYHYGDIPDRQWIVSVLYLEINRFAVPCFFMITGALLLGKDMTMGAFFRKRFKRILIPFIFWSVIIILYYVLKVYLKGENIDYFKFIMLRVVYGASYQMWYVYAIIFIYLIFPVINKWIIHSNKKEILYIIGITFICCLIAPFYPSPSIQISFFSSFLILLILGYYIVNYLEISKTRLLSGVLIFIFFGVYSWIVYASYINTKTTGSYQQSFEYKDILQAISIFILFKINHFFNKPVRILSLISKYSFGIYLTHILVMELCAKLGLAYYSFNPLFSIPITATAVIVICVGMLMLLEKIPYGRYINK